VRYGACGMASLLFARLLGDFLWRGRGGRGEEEEARPSNQAAAQVERGAELPSSPPSSSVPHAAPRRPRMRSRAPRQLPGHRVGRPSNRAGSLVRTKAKSIYVLAAGEKDLVWGEAKGLHRATFAKVAWLGKLCGGRTASSSSGSHGGSERRKQVLLPKFAWEEERKSERG